MVSTIDEIIEKSRKDITDGASFEEALQETRFGKFHYALIFVSGIFMASSFYETMGVNYILPIAECDLNITSKQQYGIISGIWFAGIILTSHGWGFVSDTYGRKNVLIIATLSASIASILSSLVVNLWQLAFFRFLNGLCISGSVSTIYAYLGEFLDARNRTRSIMISSVIFGACALFLPIMAWLIINQQWSFYIPLIQITYKPWRCFLVACGVPSMISGLSLIFFPESPKFTFAQGDEARTLKIFQRIYYVNTGRKDYQINKIKPNEEFQQPHEREHVLRMMLNQSTVLFRDYRRSIILMSMIQFGMYFVCNGMLLFFPDIINQTALYLETSTNEVTLCEIIEHTIEMKRNISNIDVIVKNCVEDLDISAYYYALILEACYTGGFFIVSLLVNCVGRLAIFSFVSFSTGICGFLIVWISNTTIAIYLYVWLLTCGVIIILLNAVAYDLFPTNLRAMALSVSLMFGRLASLVGGNVAGLLLEKHCSALYIVSGTILVFSGILTFFIPNIRKRN